MTFRDLMSHSCDPSMGRDPVIGNNKNNNQKILLKSDFFLGFNTFSRINIIIRRWYDLQRIIILSVVQKQSFHDNN